MWVGNRVILLGGSWETVSPASHVQTLGPCPFRSRTNGPQDAAV